MLADLAALSDMHPFVLALFVIAVSFVVKRAANRRPGRFDPGKEANVELTAKRQLAESVFQQHQVELQEIARSAEATLQTRIQILDGMVTEADREIERLESLLDEIRDMPSPRLAGVHDEFDSGMDGDASPLRSHHSDSDGSGSGSGSRLRESSAGPPQQESPQFIRLLHQSGFNAAEIARGLGMPLSDIQRILGEPDADSQAA